ncbi:hypothetical protein M5K25_022991 [Dendrobium thyrsiflorum]|uniref:Uncharacterized protein n=1 Tax=Dendrobium thyrsiflorum TaxID=117978 RepID=A0ABD0U719_DENTH
MMPKKKKAKVAESGEGEGSGHVDEEFVRSISEIKYVQSELKKIEVEEDDKVLEVLEEYSEIRREIYTRRNEVLLTIVDFWLTVLINHPILSQFLSVEDRKILSYLVSLEVEESPKLGYSITFNFSPNPYFENKKLTKTFSFPDPAASVITGATINWKEGLVSAEPSNYKWTGGEVIMHCSNPCFSQCFKHNANKSAHEAGQGTRRHKVSF